MKNDPAGFAVYAHTAGATGWYNDGVESIDGTNNHVFQNNGWGFSSTVLWPVTGYPMAFMAYYPDSAVSKVITSVNSVVPPSTTLILGISIPASKDEQEDVLIARDTAKTGKPVEGQMSLRFRHILSKVNFTVTNTVSGQTAYVLAVGFCNLFSKNTFNAANDNWNVLSSGVSPIDTFDYYHAFKPLSGTEVYTPTIFTGADKASFFAGTADETKHLILLPQRPVTWDITGTSISAPGANEAYIRMLYRLVNATVDIVGFATAALHDDYVTGDYAGPLYVLVGFSFDAIWESGGSYQYDIPIPGTGGGILLDTYYYDNQGAPTKFIIDGKNLYDRIM